jgi:hypothetical protein
MIRHPLGYIVIMAILYGFLPFTKSDYAEAKEECPGSVCFSFAFGAYVNGNGNRQLVKIERDRELKTGDKLKMLIRLKRKCYLYVFYYSAQGQLYMLFPYSLDQFTTDYVLSKKYYIPQGDSVFQLDDTVGEEKFFLIASVSRLSELENLYGSYESVQDFNKPEYLQEIIAELKRLRKKRKLTIEAERPLTTLGPIRSPIVEGKSEFKELDKVATEYNAEKFFAKTITIEHK